MRFVVVAAEIIGNLSAAGQNVRTLDGGHIWDISVVLMRSLPCFNRALSCLSVVAARTVSRATGGRLALPM